MVLDATHETLSDSDRRAWSAQLANLDHLKRLHADRMVTFYFQNEDSLPRLADRAPDRCLARFRIEGREARVRVNVFAHEGLLSSLEFSKDPKVLGDGQPISLTRQPLEGARSIDAELDRQEHR